MQWMNPQSDKVIGEIHNTITVVLVHPIMQTVATPLPAADTQPASMPANTGDATPQQAAAVTSTPTALSFDEHTDGSLFGGCSFVGGCQMGPIFKSPPGGPWAELPLNSGSTANEIGQQMEDFSIATAPLNGGGGGGGGVQPGPQHAAPLGSPVASPVAGCRASGATSQPTGFSSTPAASFDGRSLGIQPGMQFAAPTSSPFTGVAAGTWASAAAKQAAMMPDSSATAPPGTSSATSPGNSGLEGRRGMTGHVAAVAGAPEAPFSLMCNASAAMLGASGLEKFNLMVDLQRQALIAGS